MSYVWFAITLLSVILLLYNLIFTFAIGRKNYIAFTVFSKTIFKINIKTKKNQKKIKRKNKINFKTIYKTVKFINPGSLALKKMSKVLLKNSGIKIEFSTANPFYDGVLHGLACVIPQKTVQLKFSEKSYIQVFFLNKTRSFFLIVFIWGKSKIYRRFSNG